MDEITKIAIFRQKRIRKIIHKNEWWFSVVDVCTVLTDSIDAGAYWRKLKQRLGQEGSEVVTFCHGLKLLSPDGKMRETDCANTEGIFRIIQSIPLTDQEREFKDFIMKASEILWGSKDNNRFNGQPGETLDQLAAKVPKHQTFQSGFQGDGQILFTAQKVGGTKI